MVTRVRNKLNENNRSFDVKKDETSVKGYTDPKRAQRDHRVRLLKAGLGIVVVLALIGASIYGIMQVQPRESSEQKKERAEFRQAIEAQQRVSSINKDANKGDIDGSLKQYDSAVEKTSNVNEKSMLQMNKSILYFNAQPQQLNEALVVAKNAYETDNNYVTTKWLATVYEANNDTLNAIKYYKLSIDLIPENAGTEVNKQQLQDKLKELGA